MSSQVNVKWSEEGHDARTEHIIDIVSDKAECLTSNVRISWHHHVKDESGSEHLIMI